MGVILNNEMFEILGLTSRVMFDLLGLTSRVMFDLLGLYTMGLLFYLFLSSIYIVVFHNFSLLNHIYIIFNYFSIIFTIHFSIKNYI